MHSKGDFSAVIVLDGGDGICVAGEIGIGCKARDTTLIDRNCPVVGRIGLVGEWISVRVVSFDEDSDWPIQVGAG